MMAGKHDKSVQRSRRRFQFAVGTMFAIVFLASAFFAIWAHFPPIAAIVTFAVACPLLALLVILSRSAIDAVEEHARPKHTQDDCGEETSWESRDL